MKKNECEIKFNKLDVNKMLNYHSKDKKREEAPSRISKYGRSTTVAPPPRSNFSTLNQIVTNPPTVTSIEATEAGELMRNAQEIYKQSKISSKSQPKY